jgi:hypothetical protein
LSKFWNLRCILCEIPDKKFGSDSFKTWDGNGSNHLLKKVFEADRTYKVYDPLTKVVKFSNTATGETFCVNVSFHGATPYIYVAPDLVEDSKHLPNKDLCFDDVSYTMHDRKVVMASVVCGVKDGNRVYFLDVCMQDSV